MLLRRAVKAAGLTASAALAAVALLEERRRRKLALPGLISTHCVAEAGGAGESAAAALDEHGCCVIRNALPAQLSEPETDELPALMLSRLARAADAIDPKTATLAAATAAAALLPAVHVGDGHLSRNRAAVGAVFAERMTLSRLQAQPPSALGCTQAAAALQPLMVREGDQADAALVLDLFRSDEDEGEDEARDGESVRDEGDDGSGDPGGEGYDAAAAYDVGADPWVLSRRACWRERQDCTRSTREAASPPERQITPHLPPPVSSLSSASQASGDLS